MDANIDRLLYLDREFISTLYEIETGASPEAVITKTEGLNAGVQIPLFNAKASSIESKSYSLSSFQMVSKLSVVLEAYPAFDDVEFDYEEPSVTCWVSGTLSATRMTVTRSTHTVTIIGAPKDQEPTKNKVVAEEEYWQLRVGERASFALITSNDYFTSGVEQFSELIGTVIDQLTFPVNALIRVYSAKSPFEEWVAVPFLIVENCANKPLQVTS